MTEEPKGFEQLPWGLAPVRNEGTVIGPDDPMPQQIQRIDVLEILERTAREIREANINGWGNACDMAADEIRRLRGQLHAVSNK